MAATVSVSSPIRTAACSASCRCRHGIGPSGTGVRTDRGDRRLQCGDGEPVRGEAGRRPRLGLVEEAGPLRRGGLAGSRSRPARTSRRPSRTATLTASHHSTHESPASGSAWVSSATARAARASRSRSSRCASATDGGAHQRTVAGRPAGSGRRTAPPRRASPRPADPPRGKTAPRRPSTAEVWTPMSAGPAACQRQEPVGDGVQRRRQRQVDAGGRDPGDGDGHRRCRRSTPPGRSRRARHPSSRRARRHRAGGRTRTARRARRRTPVRAARRRRGRAGRWSVALVALPTE